MIKSTVSNVTFPNASSTGKPRSVLQERLTYAPADAHIPIAPLRQSAKPLSREAFKVIQHQTDSV